ncbi:DJ-1/PfpI family protein [Sphingobacterium pedocola]|nr:DJ-1/PfpI family protein [Sphingobacterium pedocola]
MFHLAILVSDGFDEQAVKASQSYFKKQGYSYELVSPKKSEFARSWSYKDWGASYAIDRHIHEADPTAYDALIMPGGALSIDNLRTDSDVQTFVQSFVCNNKLIGTLCHGVWPLLDIGYIRGKHITSVRTIKVDIENAGGIWEDEPVVVYGNLISSRTSDDMPDFHRILHEILQSRLQVLRPNSS